MAHASVERRLAELDRRLGKVEVQVNRLEKADTSSGSFFREMAALTVDEGLSLVGWLLIGFAGSGLLLQWFFDSPRQIALIAVLAVGVWLALRKAAFFGQSASTLQLLNEERAGRRTHAAGVHHKVRVGQRGGSAPIQDRYLVATLSVCLGLVLSLAYVGLVYRFVQDASWQLFALLLVMVPALVYSLQTSKRLLGFFLTGAIYLVLILAAAPAFAILCIALVSLFLAAYAWQREDWRLLHLVVVGTYFSLIRWAVNPAGAISPEALRGTVAELLLAANLLFTVPFLGRRRAAQEREAVRAVVVTNIFAFTLFMTWLVAGFGLTSWSLLCSVFILVPATASLVAWQRHGRLSYAKYYALAALASLLVVITALAAPAAAALAWFIAAIALLTLGFAVESYTLRLAGLFSLVGSIAHYLVLIVPTAQLTATNYVRENGVWLGILMVAFLCLSGMWFRQVKGAGAGERPYASAISTGLYLLAGLVALATALVEVVTLSI